MLNMKTEKFKAIKNKSIPSTMRPRFRNKAQSNIYFLSQRKVSSEKRNLFMRRVKLITFFTAMVVGGYFLSN